ncbi:MAG: polyprenyl synthetase family protein [Rikenellaceae bacterium]
MNANTKFFTKIQLALSQLEISGSADSLYEPIRYTLSDGGKRMRPLLCLLSASLFCDDEDMVFEKGIHAAMALEIFHNFTLLHDDIMDSAPTRRGRPTVHIKWGENSAILSGDAMMALSYQVLIGSEPLGKLMEVFSRAAIEVCEGQQLDMEFEEIEFVSESSYMEMIRLKTAALIAASTKMGAIIAGATPEECDNMYRYGENIGLAFQIQDDLLDTFGDTSTFGKKIGGDIAEGKQTYLRIKALKRAGAEDRRVLIESRDYSTVRKIYEKLSIEELAKEKIKELYTSAERSLEGLDPHRCSILTDYCEYLLHRNK